MTKKLNNGQRQLTGQDGKVLPVDFDWQLVIRDLGLNDEGELFLSHFASQIEAALKIKAARRSSHRAPNLGVIGARELAISILATCWDGSIPENYPTLVDINIEFPAEVDA